MVAHQGDALTFEVFLMDIQHSNPLIRHQAALLAQCPPAESPPNPETLPIHVTTWGETGEALLMVHGGVQGGLLGGPSSFLGQKPLAERGWILKLVDRPGFGLSPSRGPDDMEAGRLRGLPSCSVTGRICSVTLGVVLRRCWLRPAGRKPCASSSWWSPRCSPC